MLLIRLGVPLVSDGSTFFLIADVQLPTACDIAADEGSYPEDEKSFCPAYNAEFSGCAVRYIIDDTTITNPLHSTWRRLVFLPLSWPGITFDELEPAEMVNTLESNPPYTIWVVPLAAACVAYIRIAVCETSQSELRRRPILDVGNLVAYNLFDMTYKGDYDEIISNEVPLSEKEILEMENAASVIGSWNMREDEQWIKEYLVRFVSAKATFDDLSYRNESQ